MLERYYKVIKANFLRPVGTILQLSYSEDDEDYKYYSPVNKDDVLYNRDEAVRNANCESYDEEVITQYIVENSPEYFVKVEKQVTYIE